MADELGRCHRFLGMFRKFPEQDKLHRELRHCLDVFVQSKVKVAVIDNGVDQMHFALSQSIDRGASFVRAGGATEVPELPWYTAADPHGTQMAYLIHSINPWCRLYPLRVGTLQKDIDADAAVKVNTHRIARNLADCDFRLLSGPLNRMSILYRSAGWSRSGTKRLKRPFKRQFMITRFWYTAPPRI